jgi:tetratricopeptide (TPR) repeat protein
MGAVQKLAGGCDVQAGESRAAIELFKRAYEIFPDIVAVNQIALAYEMIGEFEAARRYFLLMHEQAARETNAAYLQAAAIGLERTK